MYATNKIKEKNVLFHWSSYEFFIFRNDFLNEENIK